MISKQSKVGFAIAIFELSKEGNKARKIYSEIKVINEVIEKNPEFISMLSSTSVAFTKKVEIIDEAFKGFDEILLNSMKILAQNNKFNFINDIISILIEELQKELNFKEGIVYSAFELSEKEMRQLEIKMTQMFNAKVELRNKIDKELIGGFKIVIDDIVIEDSVKADLDDLKEKLLYKGEF